MNPVTDGAADRDTRTPDVAAPAPHTPVAASRNSPQHRALIAALTLGIVGALVFGLVVAHGAGPGPAEQGDAPGASLTDLPLDGPPHPLGDAELAPFVTAVTPTSAVDNGSWHLAEGLAPPTNRWFSPLALQADPQPVHPLPFTIDLEDGCLWVSITSGAADAPESSVLEIDVGATAWQVVDYSDAVVTLQVRRGETAVANVVLTRGSPVIGYSALADHVVAVDARLEPVTPTVFRTRLGGIELGLVGPHLRLAPDGRSFTVRAGTVANWVAVPLGRDLVDLAPLAASTIVETTVSYLVVPDLSTTTVSFASETGSPALFGLFSRLAPIATSETGDALDCRFGLFDTPLGRLQVCAGTGYAYAVPTLDPFVHSEATIVRAPDPATAPLRDGASELLLARAAGDDVEVRRLTDRLAALIAPWAELEGCATRNDQCFAYDSAAQTMITRDATGGVELGDARLLRAGDVLFAAGVLAEGESSRVVALRPMMTLLAADIAGTSSQYFASRRAFDPVSGFSWASCAAWMLPVLGAAPCDDPQPLPTAVAIDAYTGVARWAVAAGDPWLLEQMTWMLSVEQLTPHAL